MEVGIWWVGGMKDMWQLCDIGTRGCFIGLGVPLIE